MHVRVCVIQSISVQPMNITFNSRVNIKKSETNLLETPSENFHNGRLFGCQDEIDECRREPERNLSCAKNLFIFKRKKNDCRCMLGRMVIKEKGSIRPFLLNVSKDHA